MIVSFHGNKKAIWSSRFVGHHESIYITYVLNHRPQAAENPAALNGSQTTTLNLHLHRRQ